MSKLNLLLIMFDDLRPELTVYNRFHMIDPNFQRLANRSVIFDKAFAQIAVCNPSRDSMLTGLRPDTVGTYQFQSSFRPHMIFQNQLVKAGYATAGYGKIAHWETSDREIWSSDAYEGDWYTYQNRERNMMNSSTMPDKVWPEENFRDHIFATRAVTQLEKFYSHRSKQNFMLGVGFKNPHLQVHIPYAYYEMYKNRTGAFKLTKKESRFPHSTPDVAYRCCAEPDFIPMAQEGALRNQERVHLGDINMMFTEQMRNELMLGYCAAITFVDKQVGRLLDVLDKHNGWNDTVVILTADHGMHNGEKGLWEKWSMFDESTRVPLFIYDPRSPFSGQHYSEPVELIDVYPTITDLLSIPYEHEITCEGYELFFGKKKVCHQLQGKSLSKIVLGRKLHKDLVLADPNHKANERRLILKKESYKVFAKDGSKPAGSNLKDTNLLYLYPVRRLSVTQSNSSAYTSLAYDMSISEPVNITGVQINSADWYYFFSRNSMDSQYNSSIHSPPDTTFNKLRSPSVHRYLADRPVLESVQPNMPKLIRNFAISQSWRCAKRGLVSKADEWKKQGGKGPRPWSNWFDCDKTVNPEDELSIMGYSIRTTDWRYTSWFHYNRKLCLPLLDSPPYDEELYDHRGEKPQDFTHMELVNLIRRPGYEEERKKLRSQLVDFVRYNNIFRGCYKDN